MEGMLLKKSMASELHLDCNSRILTCSIVFIWSVIMNGMLPS